MLGSDWDQIIARIKRPRRKPIVQESVGMPSRFTIVSIIDSRDAWDNLRYFYYVEHHLIMHCTVAGIDGDVMGGFRLPTPSINLISTHLFTYPGAGLPHT